MSKREPMGPLDVAPPPAKRARLTERSLSDYIADIKAAVGLTPLAFEEAVKALEVYLTVAPPASGGWRERLDNLINAQRKRLHERRWFKSTPTPKPVVTQPTPTPAPKPAVAQPAPKPAVAQPAPKPAVAQPKPAPQPAPKPAVAQPVVVQAKAAELAPEEDICFVCHEKKDANMATMKLACKHCAHASCLITWFGHSPSCPMCRATIDPALRAALAPAPPPEPAPGSFWSYRDRPEWRDAINQRALNRQIAAGPQYRHPDYLAMTINRSGYLRRDEHVLVKTDHGGLLPGILLGRVPKGYFMAILLDDGSTVYYRPQALWVEHNRKPFGKA